MKAVGVFSLLGDSVQATLAAEAPALFAYERTERDNLDFKGIGFDLIALRAAREALRRAQPAARVEVFRAPAALTVTDQRAVATGAANAELPDWMLKTLADNQLTHLLLVTRARGTLAATTGDNYDIGRGTVEGIGFFMDTLYTMKNSKTGELSSGLLAPYMQIKLTLMDAQSGDTVASYDIKDAYAYASAEGQAKADPWTFMSTADKVTALRDLVAQGMQRGMAQLLQGGT